MEAPEVRPGRRECLPAEHQGEQLQGGAVFAVIEGEQPMVMAGDAKGGSEIDLEELLGDGPRTGEI